MISTRLILSLIAMASISVAEREPFRPPAVPLIVSDPYLSMWSRTDNAFDSFPTHWTGATMPIVMMVRVDGKAFLLIGKDTFSIHCGAAGDGKMDGDVAEVEPAMQISVQVRKDHFLVHLSVC